MTVHSLFDPDSISADLRLRTLPTRVYTRTSDFNREGLEGWAFTLGVESPQPVELAAAGLVITLFSADQQCEQIHYSAAALTARARLSPNWRSPEFRAPTTYWVWALRLRFSQPARLAVDRLHCALTLTAPGAEPHSLTLDLPVLRYTQQTKLLFPFRGPGIITQGGLLNGGHRNRSGQFAVDALGLTPDYAPILLDSSAPEAYAGWERPILAPAAGIIVFARGDRPDQPVTENSDPAYYAPEYSDGGDPGNYVVIDHGNGEFSMIAHLRQGSLRVAVGERVEAGQVLGVMGNSGDSTGPHLHHQLQSGPDWEYADALPHHYENGPDTRHDRGWYFSAE